MRDTSRQSRRRGLQTLTALASVAALSGCSAQEWSVGFLPTTRDTTNHVNTVIDLWNGSWIAGLAVGVLVWGLIIVSIVAFRRRPGNMIPKQTQYNVPLETVCTVVPIFMVGVLFFYTAEAQAKIEARDPNPDVKMELIAKQWAWDFNYTSAGVYETTQQVGLDGTRGPEAQIPVLYLPVNKSVELTLKSRDVIHSFWVPAFLYKKDMIPGYTNYMTFTPQKVGTFDGKCAELCGEFHSEMLFQVKVVEQAEYEAKMKELAAKGQTGSLPSDLGRAINKGADK